MSKIKKGSKVEWTCSPKKNRGYNVNSFDCKGIVTGLKASTFGNCRTGMGASIKVTSKKYCDTYGKKTAFISVKNLRLA